MHLKIFIGAAALLVAASSGCRRSSAQAEHPAITHHVTIEAMKFSPARTSLRLGDKIEFKNQDLVPHTVTSEAVPPTFDSKTISSGQSWTFSADGTGTFHFRCSFHPAMEGSIVVTPP
jgi:plastocyanin